jgi:hypothetical protein
LHLALGKTVSEQCSDCRAQFEEGIPADLMSDKREYLFYNNLLGKSKFRLQLEEAHNIRFGHKKRRPNHWFMEYASFNSNLRE